MEIIKLEVEIIKDIDFNYIAILNSGEYQTVVKADSISNCFKELSTSILVLEKHAEREIERLKQK